MCVCVCVCVAFHSSSCGTVVLPHVFSAHRCVFVTAGGASGRGGANPRGQAVDGGEPEPHPGGLAEAPQQGPGDSALFSVSQHSRWWEQHELPDQPAN